MADSALSVGHLSSFLLYAAYVGIALGGLSSFYSEMNRGLGASTRLFQLIDRQPEMPLQGGKSLWGCGSGSFGDAWYVELLELNLTFVGSSIAFVRAALVFFSFFQLLVCPLYC